MITGLTCSCFDLLHAGHVMMLKECKRNCDKLIVALQTDPSIDRPDEKNKPIQDYFERYLQLEAIKYVDEICPYETEDDLIKLVCHIRPDIRFIGEDWKNKDFTGKQHTDKIHYTKRYGYSTTILRRKVFESEKEK